MSVTKSYSPLEERLNILSHALGFILSCFGFALILTNPLLNTTWLHTFSFSVFAISLMVLYAASTLYHRATNPKQRARLRVFDHAAIFISIAGTYTPFTLVALNSDLGWTIFSLVWALAFCGVIFKLFFTGRFTIISTLMYVFMGGLIVFFIEDLQASLPIEGYNWLRIGGLSFVIGAIIYAIKAIPFNHAIFHVFVLFGSISHFISVYFYILS